MFYKDGDRDGEEDDGKTLKNAGVENFHLERWAIGGFSQCYSCSIKKNVESETFNNEVKEVEEDGKIMSLMKFHINHGQGQKRK